MSTCTGSIILHRGDLVAGCTRDEVDGDGACPGLELRHEGDPVECWQAFGGCHDCGIHEPSR